MAQKVTISVICLPLQNQKYRNYLTIQPMVDCYGRYPYQERWVSLSCFTCSPGTNHLLIGARLNGYVIIQILNNYRIKFVYCPFSLSGNPNFSFPSAILFIRKLILCASVRIVCIPSASCSTCPAVAPCTLFQY